MKITVLLPNGMFGYLTNVCNCDECKKRGQAEFQLFDEKGRYIQHVKYSELKDREIIEHYNPYDLCDLLHEKLISRKKSLSERFMMAKHLKKTRGVMNLLTKEECEKALEHFEKCYWDQDNSYGAMNGVRKDLDILNKLIHEHFSNPPLKFEEIKKGMWVWINGKHREKVYGIGYDKVWNCNLVYICEHGTDYYGETYPYEPNRFYRKEVQE